MTLPRGASHCEIFFYPPRYPAIAGPRGQPYFKGTHFKGTKKRQSARMWRFSSWLYRGYICGHIS
ncbi:MAG: hypothetical protein COA43_04955 [Robiginitomaculum sp.]|nr:MAG: hypothetical protein COA43_04955 [Robiginitomaculum sp.]